ncbi:MAG: MFS transporter [Rhodovulum sulfidophilum]|uniref:MFS transporter n=1 Tax=Rhodovulum sulfidophilum TaxID=35806 RepID=A0A2W5Q5G0_RHOSU|nr:MAG: MFS transporter [Rhodovulum sulfidophilum]
MPRERIAVSVVFLLNGYLVGNWAPRIPGFKTALGIDEAMLGLMILAFGVGSLVTMPLIGAAIAHDGSRRVLRALAFCLAPCWLLLTLAPSVPAAFVALFVFGGVVGGMDVAMNANAVSVERSMRRAIMSSCHGFWSLGGLIGAATGGFLLGRFGDLAQTVAIVVVCLLFLALVWTSLRHDRAPPATEKTPIRLPRTALPWLIGVVALMCMIPEGSVLDWSALYLRTELGASVEVSGLAFAAFSATMAVMRFSGDPIRDRFGAVRTLRVSALIAAAGLLAAGFAPNPAVAIAGFAIAGLGISNLVPIAFSAAGNLPGLAPGVGISLVTFLGYSGMLFAPSFIGFVAHRTGLGPIFATLPLLYLLVLALAHHMKSADMADGGH